MKRKKSVGAGGFSVELLLEADAAVRRAFFDVMMADVGALGLVLLGLILEDDCDDNYLAELAAILDQVHEAPAGSRVVIMLDARSDQVSAVARETAGRLLWVDLVGYAGPVDGEARARGGGLHLANVTRRIANE